MSKLKEVIRKVTVKKTVAKEEKKPEVCPNCEASGLKCSVCGAGNVV